MLQLIAPDLTYSLIQPLYDKYSRMHNMAIVFCFLLNRVHFLRDQNLSSIPLSQSRATLCEIMAIKLLRDWASSTLELATVMTTYWCIFAGAGPEVVAKADESRGEVNVNERIGNAIEMAIIGQAKRFIKSDAFQKVIGTGALSHRNERSVSITLDCIWSGRVVYQAESDHSFLSDVRGLCRRDIPNMLMSQHRHTKERQFTSMIHGRRLFWTTIVSKSLRSERFWNTSSSFSDDL